MNERYQLRDKLNFAEDLGETVFQTMSKIGVTERERKSKRGGSGDRQTQRLWLSLTSAKSHKIYISLFMCVNN